MSAFYRTVIGSAQTNATRRGHKDIKVAAQSWDGSVITRLYYEDDVLMCNLQIVEGSSTYGYTVFNGTLEELENKLKNE